jgi:hypothetical protein
VRLGALSVLVYLGDEALEDIAALLEKRSKPLDYEVHFSLFCRLERKRYKLEARVLKLLESYLVTVPSSKGQAAWMAGDLLHHWGTQQAMRILCRAARRAVYPAGRIGAVHGLQHILNAAKSKERAVIVSLLNGLSREDSSTRVRKYAEWTLQSGGCWSDNRANAGKPLRKAVRRTS